MTLVEQQAFDDAKAAVARNTAACDPPELSDADIESLVQASQIAFFWKPNVYLTAGTTVVSSSGQGRYWVVSCGTTGATEPDWTTFSQPFSCLLVDGTVQYRQLFGQAAIYNVSEASAEGWLLKAGRAAPLVATGSPGQSTQLQAVNANCRQMAAHYQRQGIA